MSYLFRDQRVINELERPKSSDFNIAQSLQTRNLASVVQGIYSNGGVWSQGPTTLSGFDGPRSMRVTVSTAIRRIVLSAGMALASGVEEQDIDGISGVSAYGTTRLAVLRQDRPIAVPVGPTNSTECRIDVLAIKPLGYLADYISTDIFNPTAQSFGAPVVKPKALRWDLYDVTMQELSFDGIANATSALIYVKGAVGSYSDPDSFLSATMPSLPSGYIAVAAINVRGGEGSNPLSADSVRDMRYILSPSGNRNQLNVFTRCGSKTNSTGQQGYVEVYAATNGGYTAPRFIVRNANATLTEYQAFDVCIFTNHDTTLVGGITGVPFFLDFDNYGQGQAQVMPVSVTSETIDSAFKSAVALTDVTPSNPAVLDTLAIGQKYIRARFALVKAAANTSTGAITLNPQSVTFGISDMGVDLLRPNLQLTVDWYPFSYD